MILGNVAGVATVAYVVDDHLDHPAWLRDLPILRHAVDVVLLAATIPVVVLFVYAAVVFWQNVVGIAVVGVVLWMVGQVARAG